MNSFRRTFHMTWEEMIPGRRRMAFLALIAVFLLSSAGAVLAQSASVPSAPPDAASDALSGRAVFNDKCAGCHGLLALGDGEAVSELGGNMPTALADPDFLRAAVPGELFGVITEGRVEKLMPPFGAGTENVDPLPETQRWDVIAYIYSLGTPEESVALGRLVYDENCLACHGSEGLGDGPQAGDLENDPGNLSDPSYWSQVSNQKIFDILSSGSQIPEHEYGVGDNGLAEDEIWSAIDYIRTLSYVYLDAQAPFKPLDAATVFGNIVNGTTGEAFAEDDASAELRGYNQDLVETLVMTTMVDAEGGFIFELTDVPPDQFYRVGISYGGVEFGSDFGGVTPTDPELELPITVFETSSDPSVVSIDRLHQILSFFEGGVSVSEIYFVNNDSNSVYVGESGNPDEGTFEMVLPGDAQEIAFQRAFGSLENFIPANEVVFTGQGWADTFPLRPGPGTLIMLASYVLPYEEGVTISHPILYSASEVNLVLPDAGVSLSDKEDWEDLGQREMGTANVSNYRKIDVPAGAIMTLNLEGEPDLESATSSILALDAQSELLIGIGIAVVVIGVAGVFVWRWRQEPVDAELYDHYDREELLQAIADLDDDYELGRVSDQRYQAEREQLKSELVALWEEEQRS
jgi:mono/diheme cytochrome c family protein